MPMFITQAVIESNRLQHEYAADKVIVTLDGVKCKRLAALGLAFKGGTDDVRESPAVTIIKRLLKEGAQICAFDPEAMELAKKFAFPGGEIEYADSAYDAAKGAEALVILTEWNEFRSLGLKRLFDAMSGKHFFDFRNVYERAAAENAGFVYYGIGR